MAHFLKKQQKVRTHDPVPASFYTSINWTFQIVITSERDYLHWCKEKMASSNRDTGEGLILCDGLTLVVLHNRDLRQSSAAS